MDQNLETSQRHRPLPSGAMGLSDGVIDACIRGDPGAWSQFVDQYGRLVYAIPSRLGLHPDACDDVFQSVFAAAIRELPRIRDHASIPKWLMTVAHHESYRWLRRWKPAPDSASPTLPPLVDPEPIEQDLLRLERRQIVHEGLEQLGGRCQELLTTLFFDRSEPSYQEISARLGMPIGAIGPTRNRCLRKLLGLVGDRLE